MVDLFLFSIGELESGGNIEGTEVFFSYVKDEERSGLSVV